VVERKSDSDKVSLSSWIIPEKLFDCVYKTMYITDEMFQNLKDVVAKGQEEEDRTIKI
jgi:hypothetical protein